jgi:CheY-like chemotaxis protein
VNATLAQPPKVMLVEDDPDIRDQMIDALTDSGYDIVTAENGVDALSRLRAGDDPRVILLDLMMPVMDGWTFRSEQLKEARLAEIPVVVISGSQGVAREAIRLGAAGYLKKPFTIEMLLAQLQKLADRTDT